MDRVGRLLALPLVVSFLLPCGCLQPQTLQQRIGVGGASGGAAQGQLSKEELRDALNQFEDYFEETLKQVTHQLDERLPDEKMRRLTLLWKVRMMPACHTALKEEDPIKAYLNVWTLCVRMTHFFEQGSGRGLFGEQQNAAITACKQIEAEIERVGGLFMPSEKLKKAREEVYAFVQAHPIREGFANAFVRPPAPKEGAASVIGSILTTPLAPFRVMGGIDRGAEAINKFASVADRFTDIVEELPESASWQLQLTALELEKLDAVKSALASIEEFSCSAASMAENVKTLPDQVRQEASRLLDEIDAKQGALQATLNQAENTAGIVEHALARADTVAESIDRTAKSAAEMGRTWQDAARAIGQTYKDIAGDAPPASQPATQAAAPPATQMAAPPATQSASTFDINDYRKTADAMTATAVEVRQLTTEVRRLIESQQLSEQIKDVDGRVRGAVDHTGRQARGLADLLAWRGGQLILLIFALAVTYRVVIVRIVGRSKQGT
jgi:hypothetical protein